MSKFVFSSKIFQYLILILSFLGILLMLDLTYIHLQGKKETICNISTKFSCSAVNQSIYAEILGIPISILGLFFFLLLFIISIQNKYTKIFFLIFVLTTFALIYSLSLSIIEFFILKKICLFCELSKIIMLAILITSIFAINKTNEKIYPKTIILTIFIGIIFSITVYYLQTNPKITKNYDKLAQCLSAKNVFLYTKSSCSDCNQQKNY